MKKSVLITGSGTGLGKMAAIELARRSHTVYASTRFESEAEELNKLARERSLNLTAFKLDILLEEDREKLNNYDFDVLINNAAIGDSGSVSEIQVDRFKNVFETNVFSNILITQVALEKMIKKGKGRVIFISSLAGRLSIPFFAPYCSTKFAIEGFARSLFYEMKFLDYANIEVAVIEPGAYATGFNERVYEKKYVWMKENSYFKHKLEKMHDIEVRLWNLAESKNFKAIVKKYVKVVECKKLKFRYQAPFMQAFLTKLMLVLGM